MNAGVSTGRTLMNTGHEIEKFDDSSGQNEEQSDQLLAQLFLPKEPIMLVSWGEHLLPVAYAVTEACALTAIMIGLASLHFFGWDNPFMPLWAPFLLLVSNSWLSQVLKMQAFPQDQYASHKGLRLNVGILIIIQVLLTIFIVWGSLYAGNYALWDLSWVGSCVNDLLLFNLKAFSILCIVVCAHLLYYYGAHIARHTPEPSEVTHLLLSRGAIIILAILLQVISGNHQLELLLLLPIFISCGLCTRALANTIHQRYHHLVGLHGSKQTQDRLLLTILVPTCLLFIMLALILGIIASPQLLATLLSALAPAGIVYSWLTYLLALLTVVIAAPFFWILQATGIKIQFHPIKPPAPGLPPSIQHAAGSSPSPVATTGGIILILVIGMVLVWLTITLLRRFNKMSQRIETETHETLWSWELFWSQVRSFLYNLWHYLFARRATKIAEVVQEPEYVETERSEPERNVRAIYRAFLHWCTEQGQRRQRGETPYEFKRRIDITMTMIAPETAVVTEVYNMARYGQEPPSHADFIRMQQSWQQLQQKAATHEANS
jgi:hypothetical protein